MKDHRHDDNTERSDDTFFDMSRLNDRLFRNKDKRSGLRHLKNSRTSNYENYRLDNKRSTSIENIALGNMPNDDINVIKYNQGRPAKNALNEEIYSDYPEGTYTLYEIGNPVVWYNVQVQLFEKLSSVDGKTLWNDLSNGQPAR